MTSRQTASGFAVLSVAAGVAGVWLSDWFALAAAISAAAAAAWFLTEGRP